MTNGNGRNRRIRRSRALASQRGPGTGNRTEVWEAVLATSSSSTSPLSVTAGKLGIDLTRPVKLSRVQVQAAAADAGATGNEAYAFQVNVQNTNSGPMLSRTALVSAGGPTVTTTLVLPAAEQYRLWAANDVVYTITTDFGFAVGPYNPKFVCRTFGVIGTQEFSTAAL